jgi:glycosyltransferase involved in cell wall biosynthesis
VSVVVPVYNGAATIASCVEALLAQTYRREITEIVIVDNGSTDATREIAARYPVTLISETGIRTSYAARNRGIAHATGDVIAFTDADCAPAADWLEQLLAPFAEAAVSAVRGAVEDAAPASLAEEFTAQLAPFAMTVHRGWKSLVTVNVAIRRSVLQQLGAFDEQLPTGGDVDLGWRLQQQPQWRIVEAPTAIVTHRHRSTFRGVFAQYRRYGLSEVILTTLYGGRNGSQTPREQQKRMLRQLRAIASYVAGLLLRGTKALFGRGDRRYVLWPWFLLVVETGNVLGKIDGWIATRYYRRNPWANPRLVR